MRRIATTINHLTLFPKTATESSSLFQYVSRNKTLVDYFERINTDPGMHSKSLLTITQVVNGNNLSEDVFNELTLDKKTAETTLSHILYLIRNNTIAFNHGMTLYQFVTAATDKFFPDSAYRHPADASLPCEVKLISMVENNQLTEAGQQYLHNLKAQMFQITSFNLDMDKLTKAVINLPAIEQKFIKMPILLQRSRLDDKFYALAFDILSSTPLFGDYSKDYFIYPSVSFMNLISSIMTDRPVTAKPMLGSVKRETVMELHRNGQHPVTIQNEHIKSNPEYVHEVFTGRVLGGIHDWAHLFLMNMMALVERQFLFHKLIPFLQTLDTSADPDYANGVKYNPLKAFTWTLSDIALIFDGRYVSPAYRFSTYVICTITSIFLNERNNPKLPTPTTADRKLVIEKLREFITSEWECAVEPLRNSLKDLKDHLELYKVDETLGIKRLRMNPIDYDD